MPTRRLTIQNMPLRGGLTTAGQRSTISENQLWACKNMYPDLDGMMRMRPGITQHGQTLTLPASDAVNSFYETFSSLDEWDASDSGGSDASSGLNTGLLTLTQGVGDTYLSRQAADTATEDDYSVKFSMRMTNPAGSPNTGGKFHIIATGDGGTTRHEISFDATGIYVTEGAAYVIKYTPTYALDLGAYHSYELYYNSTADTLAIWFDSELAATVDMSSADNAAFQGSSETIELHMSSGTDTWTVMVTDLQYADKLYAADDLPFTLQRLVDGTQYERLLTGGSTVVTLAVATENYLYVDIRQRGAWRPLMSIQPGHTFMVPYQSNLMIYDDNGATKSRLFSWNGISAPEEVEDTPPVQFGSEHRTRLWSAGDRAFPLRVYYTASRQLDVWFAPEYDPEETFEEVLNAGFILIPSETGDKVRGIYGEYLGLMIIETDRGLWQVTGSSPQSFQVENISKRVGGTSPEGMVQVGNQLLVVGASGVVSVATAQTYGDLQTAMPSGAIADKWSSLPELEDRVDKTQLRHAYFATLPALNLAVLGMRGQGQTTLDKLFTYSSLYQQWYGPWTLNPTFFTRIEYGIPEVEILMSGDEQGRVGFTALSQHIDYGETYEANFKSPMLCGRSLDPSLTSKTKEWRSLRLYILPRVDQTFNVRWATDQNNWQPSDAGQDWSQNSAANGALSDTFRLNVDRMYSQSDVVTVDVSLDAVGRYFQFELTSNYNIELQGYQVEFLPGAEEDS